MANSCEFSLTARERKGGKKTESELALSYQCVSGDMKSVQLEFKEVKEKVMDALDMVDLHVRRVS